MEMAEQRFKLQIPSPREAIGKARKNLKSWAVFFAPSNFKTAINIQQLSSRLITNIEHFQSNYLCVFLALTIFCILTSPLLLIAIAACLGGCYIMSKRSSENPLKIGSHVLTLPQQYAVVGVLSFPLFYIAGAGAAVFWILGASVFLIVLHAAFFDSDALKNPDESFATPIETV
ncbi:hypothetical protein QYM36_015094 [Artemia franciscana]|uniref:PRA1 family protein n=1 Tax=Artemia franciscana TaxID=6661 RepID=A0AA88HH03_ARTSF|nr:hypothetical protein QYM36_015094 [Artemia franciscana]